MFRTALGERLIWCPEGMGGEGRCNEANVERCKGGTSRALDSTHTVRLTHSLYYHRGPVFERGRQTGWEKLVRGREMWAKRESRSVTSWTLKGGGQWGWWWDGVSFRIEFKNSLLIFPPCTPKNLNLHLHPHVKQQPAPPSPRDLSLHHRGLRCLHGQPPAAGTNSHSHPGAPQTMGSFNKQAKTKAFSLVKNLPFLCPAFYFHSGSGLPATLDVL